MKLLFLCSTELQLLTALNIRCHMHQHDEADIIVNNYHGEEKELAARIKKTNVFSKVFYVRSYIENETIHRYSRRIIDGEPGVALSSAIWNSLHFLKVKIATVIWGAKAYINYMISDSKELDLKKYDAFFAYIYGKRPILNNLLDYFLKNQAETHINLLDEGTGTYSFSGKKEYLEIIDKYYVYDPDVMIFNKSKCVKIPSISKNNKNFIALLNFIFQFHDSDIEDYRNSIIFFDERTADRMPKYLKGWKGLQWLIQKTKLYKKHLEEEKEFYKQKESFLLVTATFGIENVWIKLHPREGKDAINEYKNEHLKMMRRYDLPWELIALNSPIENDILIANYSSSVCLYNSVIAHEDNNNIYCILIYKLLGISFNNDVERYFEELEKKYPNLYIPTNLTELKNSRVNLASVFQNLLKGMLFIES